MNKENRLIALYLYVCECYTTELKWVCQRYSNHNSPSFTDEEVITIYLFGILEDEKFKVKAIHEHIEKYWQDWFPLMPGYKQYNKRLNRLAKCFSGVSGPYFKSSSTRRSGFWNLPGGFYAHNNGSEITSLSGKSSPRVV